MNKSPLTEAKNSQRFLFEASQKLVPWWSFGDKDILNIQTEQNPKSYLDSFYLFHCTKYLSIQTVMIFPNSSMNAFIIY